jgi:hypothetical protein
MHQELWEILVPTTKPDNLPGKNRYFTKKHHQQWDARIIAIAKGLTILSPSKGSWVSHGGDLFKERMIPVRISCNRKQIEKIMAITAKHYSQQAIMAYKLSSEVLITHY